MSQLLTGIGLLPSNPYTVVITGGIGSGKTTASDYFASLGIDVVDADIVARQVVAQGQPAYKQIIERFGEHVTQANGDLDRQQLRALVFNDKAHLNWLNRLTHPLIKQQMQQQLSQSQSEYAVAVIPLFAESNDPLQADRVLWIRSSLDNQLHRAAARDQAYRDQIEKIAQAQATDDMRQQIADDIVNNDGDLKSFYKQLEQLHQQYLIASKRKQAYAS